jgi:hypothetical protein
LAAAGSGSLLRHQEPPEAAGRAADACGCETGAAFAAAAFIASAVFLVLARGAPPAWGIRDVLVGLAVTLAAALGGKAIGIARARRAGGE